MNTSTNSRSRTTVEANGMSALLGEVNAAASGYGIAACGLTPAQRAKIDRELDLPSPCSRGIHPIEEGRRTIGSRTICVCGREVRP